MIETTAGALLDAVNGFMNIIQAYIEMKEGQRASELSLALRPLRDIAAPYQTQLDGLINQYGAPKPGPQPGQSQVVVGADAEGYAEYVERRFDVLGQKIKLDLEPIPVATQALEKTNAFTVFAVAPYIQVVSSPEAYKILTSDAEDNDSERT